MAATLTFAVICVTAIGFMLRFLAAICGQAGRPGRIGYAVQITPGGAGEDGGSELSDRPIPWVPGIPIPAEAMLHTAADVQA